MRPFPRPASSRAVAATTLEVVLAVAVATGAVAALDTIAPTAGLGVIYLLAVLFVAIRRGELAALATALLSVLTLNYFFIEPRHRLTIAELRERRRAGRVPDRRGRRRAPGGGGARSAPRRPRTARARPRPASARRRCSPRAASDVMAGAGLDAELRAVGEHVAEADRRGRRAPRARGRAGPAGRRGRAAPAAGRRARAGCTRRRRPAGRRPTCERIAEPLARLIDVALERKRADGARGRGRGDPPRRRGQDGGAARHLPRPALAADGDHHGGRRPAPTGAGSADDRAELVSVIGVESRAAGPAGRRPARPLADRGRRGRPRSRTGATSRRRSLARPPGRAPRGEHPIELALARDLPLVRADAAQLERVFANLIENAVQLLARRRAGARDAAASAAARVTVRVVDRGRGIPPAQRDARLRAVLPRARRRAAARASAWRSAAASSRPTAAASGCRAAPARAPRSRSRFPLVDAARVAGTTLTAPRVLVVDDEPQILRGAEGGPARAPATRSTPRQTQGRGARRASRCARPTRCVLDLVLPDGSGVEVCARGARAGASCRSSCCRRSATSARRCARSTPAPTTTSPSRSAPRSCSRGCGRCCAARPSAAASRRSTVGELEIDLAGRARAPRRRGGPPDADRVRPAARARAATGAGWSPTASCCSEVWGPGLRRRDPLPARPRRAHPRQARARPGAAALHLTEPGVGYRLARARALLTKSLRRRRDLLRGP